VREALTILGWALFVLSIFLPINISIGGFTEPGEPHSGFIGLIYSLAMIYSIFFEEPYWGNRQKMLDIILMAGLGLCNLVILLSPISLFFKSRKPRLIKFVMTITAIYVCTIGFVVYRNLPLLYGHYIWCLSSVIIAIAQYSDGSIGKYLAGRFRHVALQAMRMDIAAGPDESPAKTPVWYLCNEI
jgi:hypothetical protein